jgi:hypothetical protein
MAYRCTHCGLKNFEADDARCPQCLRRGGLVDLNAPIPEEQRHWGKIALLLVLNFLFASMAFYGTWDLTERSASQSWPVVPATITDTRPKRFSCNIDFTFTVDAKKYEGHELHGVCPRPGEAFLVSYDPADPSRHLTESGYLIFLDLFGLGFGAFGLVGIGGVCLSMLFPKNDRLRRFAARVGSIDAREALSRR